MNKANLVTLSVTIFLVYGVMLGISRSQSALQEANSNDWKISDLENKVDDLDDEIDGVKYDVRSLDRRIDDIESAVDELDRNVRWR